MRSKITTALPLIFAMGAPAQAQPVSWGMAQCSALLEVMESHVSREPHKAYLADAAVTMFDAALAQGATEGQDATILGQVHADKEREWTRMGYTMAFKTEFRDWVDYCKALARGHDIALDKSMLN